MIFRAHTAASSAAFQLRQHHHEFVPAMPADGVGAADARRQFACDGSKQLVAQQVSERVVDVFEVDRYPERGPPAAAGGGGPAPARGSSRSASSRRFGRSVSASWLARWENCRAISSDAAPEVILPQQRVAEHLQQLSVQDEPPRRDRLLRFAPSPTVPGRARRSRARAARSPPIRRNSTSA